MDNNNIKICLTGGGTGGSVTPLLAVAEDLRVQALFGKGFAFYWLGTKNGLEKEMVERENIAFKAITGGKLRRYFSWQNFIDPFKIIAGFFESFLFLANWRPNLILSAGSYISVPVVWAAALLKIPVMIHQLDVRPGLANKLMAPVAGLITVTFEKSVLDYGAKAVWTGNPIRRYFRGPEVQNMLLKDKNSRLPVILIIGGGTGAAGLNSLVGNALTRLTKHYNIIHITGKNKMPVDTLKWVDQDYAYNYHPFEFLHIPDLKEAYAKADVVISRCGLGTLTELCYFGKPSILVPLPDSHQEDNAQVFAQKNAAIVLNQYELTAETLVENVEKLLKDSFLRQELSRHMKEVIKPGANEKMLRQINKILDLAPNDQGR